MRNFPDGRLELGVCQYFDIQGIDRLEQRKISMMPDKTATESDYAKACLSPQTSPRTLTAHAIT